MKTVGGILSSDAEENPHFAAANHVLVPYCSSDSWSGTARPDPRAGQRFAFLGAEIVAEVVRELVSWEQLGRARELYLAGSSAGGTGVLVNLDQVRRNTGTITITIFVQELSTNLREVSQCPGRRPLLKALCLLKAIQNLLRHYAKQTQTPDTVRKHEIAMLVFKDKKAG